MIQSNIDVPEIHHSTDYDSFHFFPENRQLVLSHVHRLIDDKTFPIGFRSCPIRVTDQKYIVDGQHRFTAAKKLGIPIYYVIDSKANSDSIRICNSNQLRWVGDDYLHFFAERDRDYKIVYDLKEDLKIPLSPIAAAIIYLGGYKKIKFHYEFRKGDVKVWYFEKDLKDFLYSYVKGVKRFAFERDTPKNKTSLIFYTSAYVHGAAYTYKNDKPVYERFLRELPAYPYTIPKLTKNEEARNHVIRISMGKKGT